MLAGTSCPAGGVPNSRERGGDLGCGHGRTILASNGTSFRVDPAGSMGAVLERILVDALLGTEATRMDIPEGKWRLVIYDTKPAGEASTHPHTRPPQIKAGHVSEAISASLKAISGDSCKRDPHRVGI